MHDFDFRLQYPFSCSVTRADAVVHYIHYCALSALVGARRPLIALANLTTHKIRFFLIITELLRKETDSRSYLYSGSTHPNHIYSRIVYSQRLRLRRSINWQEARPSDSIRIPKGAPPRGSRKRLSITMQILSFPNPLNLDAQLYIVTYLNLAAKFAILRSQ